MDSTTMPENATTSTDIQAGMPGASGSQDRIVRFHNECVLIPEPQPRPRRPRMITKSYSLPLWKKKPHVNGAISDSELEGNEDTHVVFKVPVPSFASKSRSPTRNEQVAEPLPPCLVHREPSSSTRQRPIRKSSSSPSPRLPDVNTIPLRSCCADCVATLEECLRKGNEWQERFTRGATRLRSASVDSASRFATVACDNVLISASSHSGVAISVDEVDKRKKSLEDMRSECSTAKATSPIEISTSDLPKASPIEEEDEDQLFPLPSPRRSPNSSPAASPNGSTSCLSSSASRDSLTNGSTEDPPGVGKGRCIKGLLTPEASPSPPHYIPPALKDLATPRSRSPSPSYFPRVTPIMIPTKQSSPSPPASPVSPRHPMSTSPSSKRRRGSFSIPGPTSFLKAGAGMFKGVTALGSTSGVAF